MFFVVFLFHTPLILMKKILIGHNPVRNISTHDNGTDLYKFTCFACWIYSSKIESIFTFGIIYYDNTVPADGLTTQKA